VEVIAMAEKERSVELTVNGKGVGLNPFVKSVFVKVILALVETLKDTNNPDEIVVKISR
jgi:hypothetical protein